VINPNEQETITNDINKSINKQQTKETRHNDLSTKQSYFKQMFSAAVGDG